MMYGCLVQSLRYRVRWTKTKTIWKTRVFMIDKSLDPEPCQVPLTHEGERLFGDLEG